MTTGHVSYSLPAFKRARFVGRGGQVVLEGVGADALGALDAFAVAVEDCTEYLVEFEAREIWGQVNAPVLTPDGPMAYVTECEPAKALPLMLERLRDILEREGVTGTLRPGRQARHPLFGNNEFPCLGAWLFLPVDEDEVLATYSTANRGPIKQAWAVSAEETRAVLAPVINWVLAVEGPVYVTVGSTGFQMDPGAVEDFVVSTLPVDSMVEVQRIPDDRRCRRVAFSSYGAVIVQAFDPSIERTDILNHLMVLARSVAGDTRGAFIREMGTWTTSRDLLRASQPTAPVLTPDTTGY